MALNGSYEVRLTEVAQRQLAKLSGKQDVNKFLADLISNALTGCPDQAKVTGYTINEGNQGFHVATLVADGYGNLIAEDSDGKTIAQTKFERTDDEDGKATAHRLIDATWTEFDRQQQASPRRHV